MISKNSASSGKTLGIVHPCLSPRRPFGTFSAKKAVLVWKMLHIEFLVNLSKSQQKAQNT